MSENISEIAVNTLLTEYGVAVDLYKHEDTLNWDKLNHLLYVTAGLMAIVGFVYEKAINFDQLHIGVNWLVFIICIVGMLSAISFAVALRSGVHYLQVRKQAVIDLEIILRKEAGGSYVVSTSSIDDGDTVKCSNGVSVKKQALIKSPTTLMLQGIPLLFTGMWIAFASTILVV